MSTRLCVALLGLMSLNVLLFAWKIEVNKNPMCNNACAENFPNLVHVASRDELQSIHFFTAASEVLGPPSIFIVKSSNPNALVSIDWTRLLDNRMYDGIRVENSSEIYGLTYFSIVEFRDPSNNADIRTASKSNKTFIQYYLSQLEYSIVDDNLGPDPNTGMIQIKYRSDPRRLHKLVYDGGYIEIKIMISLKDIAARGIRAGLTLESEISFHKLTIRHSDSKLAVGIVLFSNITLLSDGDFRETGYLVPSSSASIIRKVSIVHLEEEATRFLPGESAFMLPFNITSPPPKRTPVLFHPSPVGYLEAENRERSGESIVVLSSLRSPLQAPNMRRRLRRSLAKALYGIEYEQNYQRKRDGNLARNPVGTRLQYFAFSAPGRKTARYLAWPLTLTLDVEKKFTLTAQPVTRLKTAIHYWGSFLLNWISSFYGQ